MTYHLFGAVLTAEGIASNNRGENSGNVTTLQKILSSGDIHTTVSAEAIRYAIRHYWTKAGKKVNRRINANSSRWQDTTFENWEEYLDNDLFGFMDNNHNTANRRGMFEISRALSTRPWTGDIVFNVASPNSQPNENDHPIPYMTEVHATRYQYLFALTPNGMAKPRRIFDALEAIQNLHHVAGNHSRYLYEFAPEATILRWTHDPVPRMMFCFEETEDGTIGADKVIDGLKAGDLRPSELVVGGRVLDPIRSELQELGVTVMDGIKASFSELEQRVARDLDLEVPS